MAPHSDKRIHQPSAADGRKRAAPGEENRDSPPRKSLKSEHVGKADPVRLRVNSSSSKPLKEARNGKPLREGQKAGAKGAGPMITKLGKGKAKARGKGTIDDIFSGVKRLKEDKKEEEVQRWVPGDNYLELVWETSLRWCAGYETTGYRYESCECTST